jgi:uncharacterized membrane protein YphA (DoxX/SURF4 family)
MKRTTLVEIIIMLYVILFLYTGISKLMEYSIFKEQISTSPLLAPFSKLIALGLPSIEFIVVVLLIIPRWRLKGLYLAFGLMTAFTIYIIAILSFSSKIPCSCGGILQELSWEQHIAFNAFFILLAIAGIVLEKRIQKVYLQQWTPAL